MPQLGRVVTAMVTPFTEEGALDLDGAQTLAAHLVAHGTDTVLVGGTTGESPTLHGDELWDLFAAVDEAVGDRAQVMVGTGTNDTRTSIEKTDRATSAGADAMLVVTPYYNKPSQRGLLAHFTDVARATDKPVLLYDIPGRTSREIALDTLIELAAVDNIMGVKDAVGSMAKAGQLVAATLDAPGGFEIYSGADENNLPLLAVGAVGFVSVASHLIGDSLQDLANVFESDPVKAREVHLRSLPLWRALFAEPSPAPLKGALQRFGLPAGPVRRPLVEASHDTVEAVLRALEPFGIRA